MPLLRRTTGTLLGAVLALASATPAAAESVPLEFAVKAAYLVKFTPFVTWPPRAFAAPTSPFMLCIVGQDPFGSALDEAVRGQVVEDHAVAVKRLAAAEPNMGCQLAFIGRTTGQSPGEALHILAGQPVLTVTDRSRGFEGGMIQFVMQDGHVHFDVDAGRAQGAGLVVSSKLLALAASWRRSTP